VCAADLWNLNVSSIADVCVRERESVCVCASDLWYLTMSGVAAVCERERERESVCVCGGLVVSDYERHC